MDPINLSRLTAVESRNVTWPLIRITWTFMWSRKVGEKRQEQIVGIDPITF